MNTINGYKVPPGIKSNDEITECTYAITTQTCTGIQCEECILNIDAKSEKYPECIPDIF